MKKTTANSTRTGSLLKHWLGAILFAACIVVPCSVAGQDTRKVSGTVTDESNLPMPGVSVYVKTAKGTGKATDLNGKYELNVPADAVLVFSFISYKVQEIPVQGKTEINVVLQEDITQLKETVIIGYQTIQREKSTAAISSVRGEVLENIPVPSVEMALQGKVAGLNVLNLTGEPGAKGIVTLRGNTSIANEWSRSTPLYVVDGIVMDMADVGTIDVTGTNPIAGVNPNDIESIDVLKDAAASAIYGARAANGVIIIKTKTPKTGAPQVRVNAYVGLSMRPTLRSTLVGTAERRLKTRLLYQYLGEKGFSDINYWITDSLNPAFNNNTDWQGIILRRGTIRNYDASIAAMGQSMSYRFSYNHYKEEGAIIGTEFKRNTASLYLNATPYRFLNFLTNIRFSETDRKKTIGDNNAFDSWTFPSSFYNLTDADISTLQGRNTDRLDNNFDRDLNANFQVNIDFLEGLKWTTSYSYNYRAQENDYFIPSYLNDDNAYASAATATSNRWEIENYLQYGRNFNETHNVLLLVGQGAEYFRMRYISGSADYIPSNSIRTIQGALPENSNIYSSIEERSRLSWFARLNYDLHDRYLFSFNWRMDGSSRFGKNNRWGHFPAVSLGWILTKEEFLPPGEVLDFLKIRGSYGMTGSDPAQFYDAYRGMTPYLNYRGSNNVFSYNGEAGIAYNFGSAVTSKDLSWEESKQMNLGSELHLLSKRFRLTTDYYIRDSEEMIFNYSLPETTGYTEAKNNLVGVRNSGVEFQLNLDLLPYQSDFQWTIDANIAINKNQIKSLPNGNRSIVTGADWQEFILTVGRPLYEITGWKTTGIYKTNDEVPVDPLTGKRMTHAGTNPLYSTQVTMQAGDIASVDQNGDYVIDGNDKVTLGNPDPKYYGGISTMLRWKNLSLRVFCNYVFERTFWNGFLSDRINGGQYWNGESWSRNSGPALDFGGLTYFTTVGQKADLPTLIDSGHMDNGHVAHDIYVDDGSFFRVKNIALSYELPQKWLEKFKLQRFRVYGYMDNVYVFSRSETYPDPENISANGTATGSEYPLPHKFTFGAEITF
ncbi:MAG: SusC/RagA family TonB-linked outer membrane protein [Odoribacteraceae bacterium]|nr:SusC/RagA family TonB-linked outer membrane protein [Odoribacteraceae bacterium]